MQYSSAKCCDADSQLYESASAKTFHDSVRAFSIDSERSRISGGRFLLLHQWVGYTVVTYEIKSAQLHEWVTYIVFFRFSLRVPYRSPGRLGICPSPAPFRRPRWQGVAQNDPRYPLDLWPMVYWWPIRPTLRCHLCRKAFFKQFRHRPSVRFMSVNCNQTNKMQFRLLIISWVNKNNKRPES